MYEREREDMFTVSLCVLRERECIKDSVLLYVQMMCVLKSALHHTLNFDLQCGSVHAGRRPLLSQGVPVAMVTPPGRLQRREEEDPVH